uniref:Uncharacterized protein n=1 Tax=Solanum lycopersicum TaxID=4081 RepID=A0A3Q7IFD1_SOLLC
MKGIGRGHGRRKVNSGSDGAGGGHENFQEREHFGTTSQPPLQQIRVAEVSLETGHAPNPSQRRLHAEQISGDPLQRTSLGTQSA